MHATAKQRTRRHPGMSLLILYALLTACEELGPEAKGENPVTALQSVAPARTCIPLFDLSRVEWEQPATIKFVLRDGSQWLNDTESPCPFASDESEFAFAIEGNEICHRDLVHVLQPLRVGFRHSGNCSLGQFIRIERVRPTSATVRGDP